MKRLFSERMMMTLQVMTLMQMTGDAQGWWVSERLYCFASVSISAFILLLSFVRSSLKSPLLVIWSNKLAEGQGKWCTCNCIGAYSGCSDTMGINPSDALSVLLTSKMMEFWLESSKADLYSFYNDKYLPNHSTTPLTSSQATTSALLWSLSSTSFLGKGSPQKINFRAVYCKAAPTNMNELDYYFALAQEDIDLCDSLA
jgi:hypothetical protein